MIILFHLLYWHVSKLIHYLTEKRPETIKLNVDDFHLDLQEKVTCASSATVDAEIGLTFDPPVYCQRYAAVQQVLLNEKWRGQIRKVVDFGCAELSFFKYVKSLIGLQEALFVDVDRSLLEYSGNKVEPFSADYLKRRREPLVVQVLQGNIANPDVRLLSTDAVICIEIIEHLYPDTLDALPHNVFHFIQPRIAVFTTPNADFNVLFPNFRGIRHYDHKFEWTRSQFEDWSHNLTVRYPNYNVYFEGIGPGPIGTEDLGCCSQMAIYIHKNIETKELDDGRKILVDELSDTDTKECKFCSLKSANLSDFLSNGVCTYETLNNNNKTTYVEPRSSSSERCEHCHMLYELVREVNHPYEVDNRSQDEIIQHESEFRMHTIASHSRMYYKEDQDHHEIPLYELTSNRDGEFISIPDLRKVLEKAGWTIEECTISEDITVPCAIYTDQQVDSSDTYTEISRSPDFNFSTDVNWDSGSQWDAGSTTEIWDDAHSNMDTATTNTKSDQTKGTSTDVWETASSNGHSDANTTVTTTTTTTTSTTTTQSELSETLPFEMCTDDGGGGGGGGSPECTSDEKVELLFDSGYQMSTSSLDLSPENVQEWLNEEKRQSEEVVVARGRPEAVVDSVKTQNKHEESSKSSSLKADGISFGRGKWHKSKLNEQRVIVPALQLPMIVIHAEQDVIEVVENGDLANNNRDREGNNYQAVEHDVQVVDNARPRPENLDEHNENHIVLQQPQQQQQQQPQPHQGVLPAPGEPADDDDAPESLEDASREVLYDPNSESSFSEEAYLGERMSFEEYHLPVLQEMPGQSSDDGVQMLARFPDWLLNILDDEQNDVEVMEVTSGDFFSQGDGLGIHPSMLELPDSGENSSASSGSSMSQGNVRRESSAVVMAQDTLTGVDSSMDVTFQDALDHISSSNVDLSASTTSSSSVNVADDGV